MHNLAIIRTATPDLGTITAVIDGVTDIRYQFGTTIGEEPLEHGVESQDHATALPVSMLITCQVGTLNGGNKPREAMAELERMHLNSEVFRAATEDTAFKECIIQRFEGNRKGNLRGLLFRMELRQLLRRGADRALVAADSVSGPASLRTLEVERGSVVPVPLLTGTNDIIRDVSAMGTSAAAAAMAAEMLAMMNIEDSTLRKGINFIKKASDALSKGSKALAGSKVLQGVSSIRNTVTALRPRVDSLRYTISRIDSTVGRLLGSEGLSDNVISGLNRVSDSIGRTNIAANRIASIGRVYR